MKKEISPHEYSKFCYELIKVYNNKSDFLKKETFQTILNHQLGFAVGKSKKGIILGYNGGNYGYRTTMRFCVEDETGIVIMQNHFNDVCINEIIKSFMEIFEW